MTDRYVYPKCPWIKIQEEIFLTCVQQTGNLLFSFLLLFINGWLAQMLDENFEKVRWSISTGLQNFGRQRDWTLLSLLPLSQI